MDITISFDGATKETFESIRAGSNFETTLEKLAMIKKLREINLSRTYAHFSFNFVALRRNIEELPEVLRIAHRFGIEDVGVADYAFGEMEFDVESLRFEPKKANEILDRCEALAAELGIIFSRPPRYAEETPAPPKMGLLQKLSRVRRLLPEANRFPRRCSSPWTEPYIRTDGSFNPCCASREYLGTIKTHSFAEVWNGWRYRLLRWRIHSPLPTNGCRRCFVAWGINGGNAGNVMAKEGLLIKAMYWTELRLIWVIEALGRLAARLGARKSPGEPSNFYRGRPISDSNRPA